MTDSRWALLLEGGAMVWAGARLAFPVSAILGTVLVGVGVFLLGAGLGDD